MGSETTYRLEAFTRYSQKILTWRFYSRAIAEESFADSVRFDIYLAINLVEVTPHMFEGQVMRGIHPTETILQTYSRATEAVS